VIWHHHKLMQEISSLQAVVLQNIQEKLRHSF
jgi:hypothetical protein